MNRLLVLLAVTAMVVLLLAPAATAQTPPVLPQTPPHLQPNVTNTPGAGLGGFEPQIFGTPQPIPGSGGTVTAPSSPAATDDQYASPPATAGQDQYATSPLPDTGGPSLGAPVALAVAVALAIFGSLALRLVRRGTVS